MIALLLALQAASTVGPIGRQELPKHGCAAYLWGETDRQLVAMATADPARLRLSLDGKRVDLNGTAAEGAPTLGFVASRRYVSTDVIATLAMTVVVRADLQNGAQVPTALLTVERPGRDLIVLPVAGLIGCT